jgi:hypothetical protein
MHKRMTTLGLLALLVTVVLPNAVAQANGSARTRNRKPPADRGPAETRAERDRRLLRECRGKPNAGACEGYSH